MSAAVCGNKRSLFEDLPSNSPPPISKRVRRSSSTSPTRLSAHSVLGHLRALFPYMDPQLLERALEECGNDLDSTIKRLNELCLASAHDNLGHSDNTSEKVETVVVTKEDVGTGNPSVSGNLPADGAEWVDWFVGEMTRATSVDDARVRAGKLLETLEKSIRTCAGAEAAQNFEKENMLLKEQIEVLIRENTILKRAVAIQHERQKEYEHRSQEVHHLKQLLSQYQEQMRTLEVNNYALTMHLKEAEQGNSMPGRFHPDVF